MSLFILGFQQREGCRSGDLSRGWRQGWGQVQGVYFAEFLLFGGMCAQLWKDGSQAEGCKKSSAWGGGGRVGGAVPALMSGAVACVLLIGSGPSQPWSSQGKEARSWRMQPCLSGEPREAGDTGTAGLGGAVGNTAKSTFIHILSGVCHFRNWL